MRYLAALLTDENHRDFFDERGYGPFGLDKLILDHETFEQNLARIGREAEAWLAWFDERVKQ